jgi:hypothetical protein
VSGIVLYELLPPSLYVPGKCRVPCILVPLFSFPLFLVEEWRKESRYSITLLLSSVSLVPGGGMEEEVPVQHYLVPPSSFPPVPGGGLEEGVLVMYSITCSSLFIPLFLKED